MFGEADLRRAVARYLAKRELVERDIVFLHLPDGWADDAGCRRMTRASATSRPIPRPVSRPPNRRPAVRSVTRTSARPGAPHFIIWSKDRVLQVELKTARARLLEIERAFGNALNALGHVYHVVRAETPRHAVELVRDLLR